MNRWLPGIVCVLVMGPFEGVAGAEDSAIVSRLYGRGVHAYFAGDTARAERELTEAIHLGSRDPRAYYFRGLTYLRMGRSFEAESDMQVGGQMETEQAHRVGLINRSLERVQGRERSVLEKFRRQARSMAFDQQQSDRRQRFEVQRRREEEVLRRRMELPLERFAPRTPLDGQPASGQAASPPVTPFRPIPAEDEPVAVEPVLPGESAAPPDASLLPRRITPPSAPPVAAPRGALPGVRTVPPEQKVQAGSLGKILSRVLGRSLPEAAENSAAAVPAEMDPFAESPAGSPAAPPAATPADEVDVFGSENEPQPAAPTESSPAEPEAADNRGSEAPAETTEPKQEDPFAVE